MLDLVYKDIVQGRRTMLLYLAAGIVLGLVMMVSVVNMGSVLSTMAVFSAYGYAIRSTYDEDKNGAILFLKGLPLSDTAIVASKYLSALAVSALLMAFFSGFAALGEGVIAPRLGLGPAARIAVDMNARLRASAREAAMIFAVIMVMLSVYLTMFFCVGYARAAAYNRFVMLGIFAFVFAGISAWQRVSPQPPGWALAFWGSSGLPALAALAGLGVYALGFVISVIRVRAKDWS